MVRLDFTDAQGRPFLLVAGAPDTENGDRVMDTLFQAQAELRTAVVIVTHDPHVAELANRILVMTEGQFAPAGD